MTIAKRIGLAVGILLGCVALLVIGALGLLSTNAAHRYVLQRITKEVQDATGARLDIAGFSIHWWRLGADFDQVTVNSSPSSAGTPLFSADRISVDAGLHLFHTPKIAIQDVELDHPVLHVSIDSQGKSNLPHRSGASSGRSLNVFHIAISHFIVNHGEFFYDNRRVPVEADLHDLNARAAYETLKKSYDTTLSYRDGNFRYDNYASVPHNLEAAFTAGPSGIALKSLVLRTASSTIQVQGTLTSYEPPLFQGSYQASLSMQEVLDDVEKGPRHSPQFLSGLVDTSGTLAYRGAPGEPVIDNFSLDGTVNGRVLKLDSPDYQAPVQNLAGEYTLKNGTLETREAEADTLGGHVSAHLVISQLARGADARLDAVAKKIAMPALRDALRLRELPGIRMDGLIDGNLHATWQGSLRDFQIFSDTKLAGTVSSVSATVNRSVLFPVNGAAQFTYDRNRKIVAVHNALLNTPQSHLMLEGSLGNNSRISVEARSEDLHEVDLLVHLFQTSATESGKEARTAPKLLDLGGMGAFTGMIDGTLANPHFTGLISATNLRVHNASVQLVKGNIEASPEGVAIKQGELRNGPQTRADFDSSAGLRDWHFTPEQPVVVHLNAEKVQVADLEHIAGFQYPIRGVLNTAMSVTGTEENPSIQGNIEVTQANLWQQPVQNLKIDLQNSGSRIMATINAQAPAGSATGSIAYDRKNGEYDLQAKLAEVQLDQVHYLQDHLKELAGVVNVSAGGRGSISSPQLNVTVNSQQLQFENQKIDGFQAQASVAGQKAEFNIGGSVSGEALRTHGTVNLTGDYEMSANIDSQTVPLGPLLQSLLPQAGADLGGQTELHGTLKGPLKDPSQLEAQIELPSFEIGYPSFQLAATGPIQAEYQRGVFTVSRTELKGRGTDVTLQASIPLRKAAELRATANGNVNLQLLQIWNTQWKTSGELNLQVGVQGTREHPAMSGSVAIADGTLAIENLPTFEKVKGELNITSESIQVKSLTGQLGGGAFEAYGSATYRPGIRYNLGVKTQKVRLFYPDGVRSLLSGSLNFTGQPDNSLLAGQVTVDRVSLTQSFDLSSFSNEFSGAAETTGGFAQNVKLNIALNSRQELEAAASQISVQGTVNLQVRGTIAEPVLIGRTNLTGGEFFFNGRRFTVQNASIEFANPVRTAPVVNLTATTTVNQFDLTVNLVGPFDRLRTTYTSNPPLAPVDIINLLLTGQTTEASQGNTNTPESVIAGQLSGQVSNRLQKLTGISSLTIDPQIGGNQGNGASQLAIQEQVTKNLFFTFATDVTTTQGEVVQVQYQITRKYSVSAIRDQTGGYEVEIKSRRTF